MAKKSKASQLGLGPFDIGEISDRLEAKREALGVSQEELCRVIKMNQTSYSLKVRLVPGRGHLEVPEISACVYALEMLRPGWTCPQGFPFIPEDLASLLPARRPKPGK